jgi:cytochrome c biogenesis protein CcmG, thiol:disulfide interchange protein DsbE
VRRFVVPLLLFVVLIGFLAAGLTLKPREVPSPLVGKPVPSFKLAELHANSRFVSPEDFKGKVWLLNVWASWCVSCRQEHPVLLALQKQNRLPIVGLNYKDQQKDAIAWLTTHGGDPYAVSAMDADGRVGINLGVYGVPETFLIDKKGVIRYKHIGPVTVESLEKTLLPMAEALYLDQ